MNLLYFKMKANHVPYAWNANIIFAKSYIYYFKATRFMLHHSSFVQCIVLIKKKPYAFLWDCANGIFCFCLHFFFAFSRSLFLCVVVEQSHFENVHFSHRNSIKWHAKRTEEKNEKHGLTQPLTHILPYMLHIMQPNGLVSINFLPSAFIVALWHNSIG